MKTTIFKTHGANALQIAGIAFVVLAAFLVATALGFLVAGIALGVVGWAVDQ